MHDSRERFGMFQAIHPFVRLLCGHLFMALIFILNSANSMHKLKDELVSNETHKLAIQKGFNRILIADSYISPVDGESFVLAPITQTLMARWLREEHEIFIELLHISGEKLEGLVTEWMYKVSRPFQADIRLSQFYPNYEYALEEALKFALNLLPDGLTAFDAKT